MTAAAPNYDRTVVACFNGYVTQAIINNFMPLLSTRVADPYPALLAAIVL